MEQKTLKASLGTCSSDGQRLTKVNVESEAVNMLELHQLVLRRNRRIELHTHDGSTCVLITKTELEALEQALEILSDTTGVREMREELSRIAAVATRPV